MQFPDLFGFLGGAFYSEKKFGIEKLGQQTAPAWLVS